MLTFQLVPLLVLRWCTDWKKATRSAFSLIYGRKNQSLPLSWMSSISSHFLGQGTSEQVDVHPCVYTFTVLCQGLRPHQTSELGIVVASPEVCFPLLLLVGFGEQIFKKKDHSFAADLTTPQLLLSPSKWPELEQSNALTAPLVDTDCFLLSPKAIRR